MPGFTPKSLLPEAAAHGGIAFPELVDRLVKRAAVRGSEKCEGASEPSVTTAPHVRFRNVTKSQPTVYIAFIPPVNHKVDYPSRPTGWLGSGPVTMPATKKERAPLKAKPVENRSDRRSSNITANGSGSPRAWSPYSSARRSVRRAEIAETARRTENRLPRSAAAGGAQGSAGVDERFPRRADPRIGPADGGTRHLIASCSSMSARCSGPTPWIKTVRQVRRALPADPAIPLRSTAISGRRWHWFTGKIISGSSMARA